MLKRFEVAILIGIIAGVIISSLGAFAGQSEQIRRQVLRLHVLANSDSEEDVALKLAVRDAVLRDRPEIFSGAADKAEARQLAQEHLEEIEQIARDEISRLGYSYEVSAQIVDMYFETRRYEGFILPAGRYGAVRIVIGQGDGQNWWCIMFPPMCIPAAQPNDTPLEEQIARLGQTPNYRPKFAVVELIESLRQGSGEPGFTPPLQSD